MRVKPVCVFAHTGFEYGEMCISSELMGFLPLMYEMGVSCIKSTWVVLSASRLCSVGQSCQQPPGKGWSGLSCAGVLSGLQEVHSAGLLLCRAVCCFRRDLADGFTGFEVMVTVPGSIGVLHLADVSHSVFSLQGSEWNASNLEDLQNRG